MNTQNILYAIDNDLNALYHEGHKGQRKGVHQFGRWQKDTVYAQGRPDPNAKEKSSTDSGKKEGLVTKTKNAVVGVKARHDAKIDAAVKAYEVGGKNTKGGKLLEKRQTTTFASYGMHAGGEPIGGTDANAIATRAVRGLLGQHLQKKKDFKNYEKRGKGTLDGVKVSDAYAKAYKSKFDDYYKKYSTPTKPSLGLGRKWLKVAYTLEGVDV